jgi:murein DD-endopeptidase MepM/ murein hydrolase activator NlpD
MKSYEFLTEAEDTKSYEIKPGDTLTKIASKNSTTIDAIMDLNQGNRAIRDRDTIYAGSTIKIPTTSTGFDSDTRVKRQGSTSVNKPDDIAKIGNQEFPLTKGPNPNGDMGEFDPGIDDTDWEFPTVELGFGDPGYTPIIGNRVEKRPNGNWYYPGNPLPVRPDVARFAEKRLKDLDIVKSKDIGSQKFPMTKGPDANKDFDIIRSKDIGSQRFPMTKGPGADKGKKSPAGSGQFSLEKNDISPIPGSVVTDEFGSDREKNRLHQGIDMRAITGTAILAPNNGRVLKQGFDNSRGGFIILGDSQGNRTHQFMHLSKILVKDGEIVRQGQEIAKSGNTGHSRTPHLHWEKYINGEPVDPSKYVDLPRK